MADTACLEDSYDFARCTKSSFPASCRSAGTRSSQGQSAIVVYLDDGSLRSLAGGSLVADEQPAP